MGPGLHSARRMQHAAGVQRARRAARAFDGAGALPPHRARRSSQCVPRCCDWICARLRPYGAWPALGRWAERAGLGLQGCQAPPQSANSDAVWVTRNRKCAAHVLWKHGAHAHAVRAVHPPARTPSLPQWVVTSITVQRFSPYNASEHSISAADRRCTWPRSPLAPWAPRKSL
jgi:hypothetical protein